jgi:hypothetical protein
MRKCFNGNELQGCLGVFGAEAPNRAARAVGNDTAVANGAGPPPRQACHPPSASVHARRGPGPPGAHPSRNRGTATGGRGQPVHPPVVWLDAGNLHRTARIDKDLVMVDNTRPAPSDRSGPSCAGVEWAVRRVGGRCFRGAAAEARGGAVRGDDLRGDGVGCAGGGARAGSGAPPGHHRPDAGAAGATWTAPGSAGPCSRWSASR